MAVSSSEHRTPRVKNFGLKNSLDKGAQLEVVWLEEAK
jgi:hypothetical protein